MVTNRLKRIIIEGLEKQLKEDNTSLIKIVFERLKKKEDTEKQAKEKVAPVLLEDTNEIIKKTGTF